MFVRVVPLLTKLCIARQFMSLPPLITTDSSRQSQKSSNHPECFNFRCHDLNDEAINMQECRSKVPKAIL